MHNAARNQTSVLITYTDTGGVTTERTIDPVVIRGPGASGIEGLQM